MPITHSITNRGEPGQASAEPALEIVGLSFSYPGGRQVLNKLSLAIGQREKVALVGPNGAGKSTLVLHLNGILKGSGEIYIEGKKLEGDTLHQIRSRLGMVFQNPDDQLFSPTVFDDVAFGPLHMGYPADEVEERVANALEMVGLSGFEKRLSHHLSMGEKKRVSIATVLSMNPGILVLDEPTSGLDPRSRRSLIRLLRELDLTMLVSTHDMRFVAELFQRMILMDVGQIVADGSTRALLKNRAMLEEHGLEQP